MNTLTLYDYYKKSIGVSIDSRSIKDGNMFFALKGPNFDGHKYINAAFDNGARCAVIDDANFKTSENVILVKNTEVALQNLARFHRSMISIPVVGITGSNGKTTTKELMSSVLSTKYSVFATKGNLNNHLGVPLSILSINQTHELAIIEMGANHVKEIKFLSEIAMPDYGLITNIGKAHLEGFGGIEGVRIGKTELYRYLNATNGTIFYNIEDEALRISIPPNTTNISYSPSDIHSITNHPFVGFKYKDISFQSNLTGTYNLTNILASMAVGTHFNLSLEDLKKGIESYRPSNNRSQIKETENNVLIMDAYNANPTSMVASIKNFSSHPSTKKILILGHMLELGDSSVEEHKQLLELISTFSWSDVYLVGSEFVNLNISLPFKVYQNVEELSRTLQRKKLKGNTILLKASRGIALEKSVAYL